MSKQIIELNLPDTKESAIEFQKKCLEIESDLCKEVWNAYEAISKIRNIRFQIEDEYLLPKGKINSNIANGTYKKTGCSSQKTESKDSAEKIN